MRLMPHSCPIYWSRIETSSIHRAGAAPMRSRHRRSAVAQLALSLLMVCGLTLAAAGEIGDIDALVANLPRGFIGDFQWDGDSVIQNVAIRLKSVRRLD